MENLNNIKITTVDLGNMNIKYIGEKSGMFSSRISTDYQAYEDGFQRVEIDGKITYIGVGELSREFNKAERDYMAQLLYATCKANKSLEIIETNLTLLLPAMQMKNKSKMIENLKNKEFNFKFNGNDRVLSIKDVLVLPEGYASFFALSEEDKQNDVCLIDAGSRTINICALINGKIQKIETIKLGSFDFYTKIRSIENGKGEDFTEEDIPRLINNGTIKVYQKQYGEFLNDILNAIKPYVNLKTYNCIWTGGCSVMLENYINQLKLPKFKILDNAINSNVIGAKAASEIIFKQASVA